ncbi:beta-1,3-glucosyltransferase isoform X1 [Rhopalosiphum padi]|uniref:beta-1,3-glucosyltransferase isoform X1 n=2 Tax=Rhopalosiphum padi TaxID=40932 RepID=UPI00298DABF4|nr:beta-1,3-glucosyltransferase isoform X1 [Rhopalosiphum padi]XP_060850333.1 beta-1,3-glucosyltransferase isoform X1 [Rhopalosiphum padi]XP_060850334.1 beta-1,3-glucosyltransferase isoform X1 [Rhopalosiphum padi]XP_060850335.1 beta-1,3-glucosyltransferase isoform X1 [Rhopalosiphum padi]XP_060850336.1 beta-1,3-glucosyltransferase isoform X1 [Rhopalosiphum padi]XP_060850337.1 beta-1,3-glucosyltransferase isoform X1 [Rhopalosiphum padi]
MFINGIYFICLYLLTILHTFESSEIVITILSQPNDYNVEQALRLKNNILKQTKSIKDPRLGGVYMLHEQFPEPGSWTIIPIIKLLYKNNKNAKWFLFCEENAYVNYDNLQLLLKEKNSSESIWMGYGVKDKHPTIIHHYAFEENENERVTYPLFAAGFVISAELLKNIANLNLETLGSDFSIDASYELALVINKKIQHLPLKFCLKLSPDCIVHPLSERSDCTHYGKVTKDSIYFAVKTCSKFHSDRVPVLQSTWGRDAVHIEYFSDKLDDTIPTTVLDVPNTERGHCQKTIAIFKYLSKKLLSNKAVKWIALTDDDTLLSVPRLASILSCWNGQQIALGQRYGYNIRGDPSLGYNYLTGGGGIIFNVALVHKLTTCKCYAFDAPDDMVLGMCLKALNATVVHSPVFHQARPQDYADEYLESYPMVSFHKHWMIDPIEVYRHWLYQDSSFGHDEL